MPSAKGFIKGLKKPIQVATNKAYRLAKKPFQKLLSFCKHPKQKAKDLSLPGLQLTHVEEDIPETSVAETSVSLEVSEDVWEGPLGGDKEKMEDACSVNSWDVESDSCSEADFNPGPHSHSLPGPQLTHMEEDIPQTSVAESNVSLEVSEDVWEAPLGGDKEKMEDACSVNSWDVESDSCSEADFNPGPHSHRVPDPQMTSAHLEDRPQEAGLWYFDYYPPLVGCHNLCKKFSSLSREAKRHAADTVAQKYLQRMLEHFTESSHPLCDDLMDAVLSSANCDVEACLKHWLGKMNSGSWLIQDTQEQLLAKKKAIKAVGDLVAYHFRNKHVRRWLLSIFAALGNVMVGQTHMQGMGRTSTLYIDQQEIIDTTATLMLCLNLVGQMHAKLPLE